MSRLELLACLVSAKLPDSVQKDLANVLKIHSIVHRSDSALALAWIRSPTKEYKQFLQNRVTEIRKIAPPEYPTRPENPADTPSPGATAIEIAHRTKRLAWPFLLVEREWPQRPANSSPGREVDQEVTSL